MDKVERGAILIAECRFKIVDWVCSEPLSNLYIKYEILNMICGVSFNGTGIEMGVFHF